MYLIIFRANWMFSNTDKEMVIKRIESIDIVRGIVMIIMALDHVRDLLHTMALTQSPTDLTTTTPILFFTRWITYLCAPTFVFLSGTSAYLSFKRANDIKKFRRFLLTRGLWLILLEFTLINFALWFDIEFRILMLQVIAAIGFGFIVLSFLLKINSRILAVAALIIIGGHNFIQPLLSTDNNFLNKTFAILFQQNAIPASPDFIFLVAYPLIPWFGVMLLGFALGPIFLNDRSRKKILLTLGIISLVLFFLLRTLNQYGDPRSWQEQAAIMFTLLSFFNVTKYPPSLQFDLLFLGIMLLLLVAAERLPGKISNIFSVYGKVPLFYYLLHLYTLRVAVFIMVFGQGFEWSDLSFAPFQFGRPLADSGIRLLWVYVVWVIIVALLYPLCKWYARYKQANREKVWLKYL